jgi:hypothetical protein
MERLIFTRCLLEKDSLWFGDLGTNADGNTKACAVANRMYRRAVNEMSGKGEIAVAGLLLSARQHAMKRAAWKLTTESSNVLAS